MLDKDLAASTKKKERKEPSLDGIKTSIKSAQQELGKTADNRFVNLDFLDWLQNKQIQTGVYISDNRKLCKNIV